MKLDAIRTLEKLSDSLWKASSLPNQSRFYAVLNCMTGRGKGAAAGGKLQCLRIGDGDLVTDKQTVADSFANHFSKVMNPSSSPDPEVVSDFFMRDFEEFLFSPDIEVPCPSVDDTVEAIMRQKCGKSADEYGVNAAMAQAALASPTFVSLFHDLIIAPAWECSKISTILKRAVLVPIFKGKGSKELCDNYRGVTLLSFPRKVHASLIRCSFSPKVECEQPEEQAGGRKGRGTGDHLFTLRALQDFSQKNRVPFCAAFVDIRKAYDSIPRELLFHMLASEGFPRKIVYLLQDLYEGTT